MFNTKRSKCKYILIPKMLDTPKSLYNNFYKNNLENFNCPSVNSLRNRVYNVNSFLTIEIEYGLKDGEPYYNYEYDKKTTPVSNYVHSVIKNLAVVSYENNIVNFQLISPYAFVTDDKELEFTTTMPNMKTENSLYVNGGFKPYYWIRNFNSAWTLKDLQKPGKLYFNLNEPFLSVIFNKSVDLKYMETTKKITDYFNQSHNITNIRSNLKYNYANALSRRPKKLL